MLTNQPRLKAQPPNLAPSELIIYGTSPVLGLARVAVGLSACARPACRALLILYRGFEASLRSGAARLAVYFLVLRVRAVRLAGLLGAGSSARRSAKGSLAKLPWLVW